MRLGPRALLVGVLLTLVVPAGARGSTHPLLSGGIYGTQVAGKSVPMDGACGAAVDASGRLYVSDYGHAAVASFATGLGPGSPGGLGGDFLGALSSTEAENSPCTLALDSAGNLYANNFDQGVVRYPGFLASPQTVDPARSTGVAVDPATGRLYVAHRTHLSAYESDGSPVMDGPEPLKIGLGTLGDVYGLAVSGFAATAGYVYVADASDETVKVYDPAADTVNPIAEIDGSATPPRAFRSLVDASLAVDDSTGHLFVVDNLQPGAEHPFAAVYEFDASGGYLSTLPPVRDIPVALNDPRAQPPSTPLHPIVHAGPSGVAIDNSGGAMSGTVYVTSGNEATLDPSKNWIFGSVVYGFCPSILKSQFLDSCALVPGRILRVNTAGTGEGRVRDFSLIDCPGLCATEYDSGTQVSLLATPRPHSAFTGWSVSAQPDACPGTSVTCKVTLTATTEVTASFAPIPQQTLTVRKEGEGQGSVTSGPAGIDCGAVCGAGFDQNSTVTLAAEAAPGSEFLGWSGAGCSGTGACQVTMSAAREVSATFRPIDHVTRTDSGSRQRLLSISVTGSGAGSITSDPAGIQCGTPCAGAYAPGAKITLTAKPDSESRFAGWSGCDSSSGEKCTVTMSQSKTVGAVFEEATPLEVERISLKGAKAVLDVALPSAGTLSASGKDLKRSKVGAKKATTVSLSLQLTKAGHKALAKKGRLKVKVTLSFTPKAGGPATTTTKTVTFKAPKKRGKK